MCGKDSFKMDFYGRNEGRAPLNVCSTAGMWSQVSSFKSQVSGVRCQVSEGGVGSGGFSFAEALENKVVE